MDTSTSPAARPLTVVDVPLGPSVLDRVLPAVEAALSGGPAILPVPEQPAPVRAALIAAMQPSRPVEPVEHDWIAFVVPTSGTTGEPKGVLLGAASVAAAADATHSRLGGSGRWLLALPATNVGGLMVLARSVVARTEPEALDLADGFRPDAFAAAADRVFRGAERRRYTALVPLQLAVVLDAGGGALEALRTFDAVLVGGSSTPPGLLDRARSAGVRVVTTYGMTETCGGCVYDGVPLDGVRVETSGDGRIRVAGPMLAGGYRLQPELTARVFVDGWFTSSDIGRVEQSGKLTVSGRVDDVAVSGGVNVPLAAVESLVSTHSGVAAAATVAVPDPSWGERVVAVVVPRDPADPPTLDSIRRYLAGQAPTAYLPKELIVLSSLPRLTDGEVDRHALVTQLLETTRH
jgi:o-succinylbenzoate---CoA ligase